MHVDPDAVVAGNAEFLQGGGQSAFGDIVHGTDAANGHGDCRFGQDADVVKKSATGFYLGRRQAEVLQPGTEFPGDDGCALYGDGFCH